ncbi:hypothetical protein R5R35_003131 [Gryllus longicercus]|uniref:Uncharacterized protein n=1 Tax=Gryllus longicercus TaxID=2509291 RepID=A0AAN9Z6D0_9ORTH
MTDETILPSLEEWLDTMSFSMSPDHLKRISCQEKLKPILNALITFVRPKETVRKAKHILLIKKQKSQEACKELEAMKKRNKLKEQVRCKEEEFVMKKKEYTKLLNENKNLLQEIQWTLSILNDEKKKLLFLLLNEKALNDTTVQYHLLRKSVLEVKEKENKKKENHGPLQDFSEVREAVFECQEYILDSRKRKEVQLESIQNISREYGCNGTNTEALEWRYDIIEFVSKKLGNIPLKRVCEVLLEQKQQIINSIQHPPSTTNSDETIQFVPRKTNSDTAFVKRTYDGLQAKSNVKALESNFFLSNYAERNGLIDSKSYSKTKQLMNESRISLSRNGEDAASCQVMENLKLSERNLLSIENQITEKAIECKNLKINLKKNLTEVSRRLSGIKQFCKRISNSGWHGLPKEDRQHGLLTNELYSCMEELCKLGPKEIQLFADLPLIALEKLTMENGKSVPVYELHSHYLRVLSNTPKLSKSTLPMMKDSCGLAPHYLLLHVWNQLSYLGELQKAHSLMKPFSATSVNSRVEPEDRSEKLEMIHDGFLGIISKFASVSDEIGTLLDIMRHHPLTDLVPKDLFMEGQPIQFYINLFYKRKENENHFSGITEEHLEAL